MEKEAAEGGIHKQVALGPGDKGERARRAERKKNKMEGYGKQREKRV